MEIESDRFQNLSYAEPAFQTEAGAVYGEYRKTRTSPTSRSTRSCVAHGVRAPPYGHTTMGYERDIAIDADAVRVLARCSSIATTARRTPCCSSPATSTPSERARRSSRSTTAAGSAATWRRRSPSSPSRRRSGASRSPTTARRCRSCSVAYKLPVYDPADRTRVAADLLADLAFGETSEAYRRLVLDEQVVEDLDAGASYNRDPGLLEISARVKDPGKIDHVLGVIDATIAELRAEQPDAKRLADLQQRLRYGFLMGLQTPDVRRGARRAVHRAAPATSRPRPAVRDLRRHHAGRRAARPPRRYLPRTARRRARLGVA